MRELVQLLLKLTVLKGYSSLRLTKGPNARIQTLGHPGCPLTLNDGRFLRLYSVMALEPTEHGTRLKVRSNGYQYQTDADGDNWIFRYDYQREPPDLHPPAHVQVRGTLHEDCLPPHCPLERIHLPTGRISLEAVIRLLVEQFGIDTNEEPAVWRPVLAESEGIFKSIAHQPLSGPHV